MNLTSRSIIGSPDVFTRLLGLTHIPPLLLAPMEGITNPLIRRLIGEGNTVNLVATEFIRLTHERQKVEPIERFTCPLQIQIMGTTPKIVGGCVRFLKSKGVLDERDWLDLNVGCPSRRVNSHGAGAALLLEPERLRDIVMKLREEHPSGPLSIKTRLGFQSDEEFPRILGVLQSLPLDFITIHGRTRCQSYSGSISLPHLAEAANSLPYPVIGNGDIWTAEDALRMLSQTGVRGLMCGRGAIANPFLFEDIRALLGGSKREDVERRLSRLHQFYTEFLSGLEQRTDTKRSFVGTAKEVICWSHRNPLVGKDLFQITKRLNTLPEIQETVTRFFSELREREKSPSPYNAEETNISPAL
jgi:tRNA-dihydrouridine synthase B